MSSWAQKLYITVPPKLNWLSQWLHWRYPGFWLKRAKHTRYMNISGKIKLKLFSIPEYSLITSSVTVQYNQMSTDKTSSIRMDSWLL